MSVLVENEVIVQSDDEVTVVPVASTRRVAGPISAVIAIGLLLISLGGYVARDRGINVDFLLWPGLMLLFLGPAWAAIAPNVRRSERIAVIVLAGVAVTVSRVLLYPVHFAYHDELLHLNSLRLIQERGHLFEATNSLLPVTKFYPGLEIATDGIHRITGLSTHVSGSILLVLGRLAMMLALVRSLEWFTKSDRVACLGAAVYACSPQFSFFNSQFSYQSVALPLSMYAVYLFGTRDRSTKWSLLAPSLALAAAAASHHLTTLGAVMVFVGWWVVSRLQRRPVRHLGAMAAIAVMIVGAWTAFAHSAVLIYVEEIAQSSADSISNVVGGKQESNELFADNGGEVTPLWQRAVSVASVLLLVGALVPALWWTRKHWAKRSAAACALMLVAALYPIIPGSHLTVASAEVGDRSSSFIFVGVAFVIGAWLAAYSTTRVRRAGMFGAFAVLFAGGIVLGAGPRWHQTPGPYLVAADNRAVDANGLATAYWMQTYLPPENRIMVDRVNGLLDATYGRQHVFRHLADRIDMNSTSTLLLRGPQGDYDKELIQRANLDYIVADRRLATGLPRFGVYIETGEDGTVGTDTRKQPPPLSAFTKFDNVDGADRVYDNGAISVYDVRGLK